MQAAQEAATISFQVPAVGVLAGHICRPGALRWAFSQELRFQKVLISFHHLGPCLNSTSLRKCSCHPTAPRLDRQSYGHEADLLPYLAQSREPMDATV